MEGAGRKPEVAIVPGNGGGGCIRGSNFYGWAERALQGAGYTVRMPEGGMPDPLRARESIWVPFITNELGAGAGTVLVGHSSGAAAALRVAEQTRLAGLVLVAGYDDDLGDELERASGYFSRPFDWARIRSNCGFVVQFAGRLDTLVPVGAQRKVASALELTPDAEKGADTAHWYIEQPTGDHFFSPPFPELVEAIDRGVAML